jgi:hypothetical protein
MAKPASWVMFATAALVLSVVAACSADDAVGEAQPVPDATLFQSGAFDELPRFPGSEEAGSVGREDEAVTQSFFADGATPASVLEYYERHLENQGWRNVAAPEGSSTGIWRGDWLQDGRRLEIIAQPVPAGTDSPEHVVTQYSLVLNDDTADNPVFTASSVSPASLDRD